MLHEKKGEQCTSKCRLASENRSRNESNCGKQRSTVSRIFVLKKHESQPTSRKPEDDRDPRVVEAFPSQNNTGDECDEQREKELIPLKRANIKHHCMPTHATRTSRR